MRGQSGRARHSESMRRLTDVGTASTTLRTFLERVGLPQLHDSFVAQDIDLSVLPSLNETHLRELGVTTIGARLRIIAAAKELEKTNDKTTTTTHDNETTRRQCCRSACFTRGSTSTG
jgi:hypothetical protein